MVGVLGCGSSRKKASLSRPKPGCLATVGKGGAAGLACAWPLATTWQLTHERRASASPRRGSAAAAGASALAAMRAAIAAMRARVAICYSFGGVEDGRNGAVRQASAPAASLRLDLDLAVDARVDLEIAVEDLPLVAGDGDIF